MYPLPNPANWSEVWDWHLLPNRLIYRPYLAGVYQPRMAAIFNLNEDSQWKWDLSIGGRVGVVRYGSGNEIIPHGWQLDVEGAAFPRLALPGQILEATDYRFGVPLSYGYDRCPMQIAYCHIRSHLGDEWAKKHGILNNRITYSRNAIVWRHGSLPTDSLRFYGQVSYGFYTDVAQPWHVEFGIEYSQLSPTGFEGVSLLCNKLPIAPGKKMGATWPFRPAGNGPETKAAGGCELVSSITTDNTRNFSFSCTVSRKSGWASSTTSRRAGV